MLCFPGTDVLFLAADTLFLDTNPFSSISTLSPNTRSSFNTNLFFNISTLSFADNILSSSTLLLASFFLLLNLFSIFSCIFWSAFL